MRLELLAFAILAPIMSAGQALRISSPAGAPGDWVAAEITFQPSSKSELAALEWEMPTPATQVDLLSRPIARAVVAAKDAGKSVACAVMPQNAETPVLHCLLAGGQKPVPGGAVAILSFRIREGAPPGAVPIRLQNVTGVTRDLKQTKLPATEAVLTIRSR